MEKLPELFEKLQGRLEAVSGQYRVSKQVVKMKFANFQTTTVECIVGGRVHLAIFQSLLRAAHQRVNLPVRLLGLGVRFADDAALEYQQLPLFASSC